MSNRLPPVVGNWYSHRDKGELFQIVALDEAAGTIEIQEFDGGLDELDFDDWRTMPLDSAAQPEDWSGPVDIVEPDEFGYTDLTDTDTTRAVEAVTTTWQEIVEDDDLDEDSIH